MKKKNTSLLLLVVLLFCMFLTACAQNSQPGKVISYYADSPDGEFMQFLCDNGDRISLRGNEYFSIHKAGGALGKITIDGHEVEFQKPQLYQCGPGSTGCYFLFAVTPVALFDADTSWINSSFMSEDRCSCHFKYWLSGYAEDQLISFERIGIYHDPTQKTAYIIDVSALYRDIYTKKPYRYTPYEQVDLELEFENSDLYEYEFAFHYEHQKHIMHYTTIRGSFYSQENGPYQSLEVLGEDFMRCVRQLLSTRSSHPADITNYLKTIE